MLREARKGWAPGRGRTERIHRRNLRALGYYGRLGMHRCKWWEDTQGQGLRINVDLVLRRSVLTLKLWKC